MRRGDRRPSGIGRATATGLAVILAGRNAAPGAWALTNLFANGPPAAGWIAPQARDSRAAARLWEIASRLSGPVFGSSGFLDHSVRNNSLGDA